MHNHLDKTKASAASNKHDKGGSILHVICRLCRQLGVGNSSPRSMQPLLSFWTPEFYFPSCSILQMRGALGFLELLSHYYGWDPDTSDQRLIEAKYSGSCCPYRNHCLGKRTGAQNHSYLVLSIIRDLDNSLLSLREMPPKNLKTL